jgi:SAM-dependent methyltransferase
MDSLVIFKNIYKYIYCDRSMTKNMNKQFKEYAKVYDELFSATCDYESEVEFYHHILEKYSCKDILEVGCGCGHRGVYFIDKGYSYVGSDISSPMLRIAQKKYPQIKFFKADVRNLKIKESFDAIVFLGKGSVYLNCNDDVLNALISLKRAIRHGLIIIDGFNADVIIPNFKKNISWSKKIGSKTITRESINELDLKTGWTWRRDVTYIVKDKKICKYRDSAILRAFTKSEFKLFFALAGITNIKFIEKGDTLISIGIIG